MLRLADYYQGVLQIAVGFDFNLFIFSNTDYNSIYFCLIYSIVTVRYVALNSRDDRRINFLPRPRSCSSLFQWMKPIRTRRFSRTTAALFTKEKRLILKDTSSLFIGWWCQTIGSAVSITTASIEWKILCSIKCSNSRLLNILEFNLLRYSLTIYKPGKTMEIHMEYFGLIFVAFGSVIFVFCLNTWLEKLEQAN